MKEKRRKYRYPWREASHFELLVDGEQFFPAMIQAIENANSTVLLEMYLVETGKLANQFINVLLSAVLRGVQVYVILDDIGSIGLQKKDRNILHNGGVNVAIYNPIRFAKMRGNLFRDHRKLLVVDGNVAFTGGAGIADDFFADDDNRLAWRETMVRISGEIVLDWQLAFIDVWNKCTNNFLTLPDDSTKTGSERESSNGHQLGRVTLSNGYKQAEIKRSLLKRIRLAEQRVWLSTAYFVPSWKIRRALRYAARNGADVRLLLPGPNIDHPSIRHVSWRYYGRLLKNGIRIFEYQPRFLHAKVLLCDHWVSIGSSNIDRWSFRWNLEANQEIHDQAFANEVQQIFQNDFKQSDECLFEVWHARPWYRRLLEWFWGRIEIFLAKQGR